MAITTTCAVALHHFLLFSLTFHPLSSTSTSTSTQQPRRILHQPLLPQETSSPPPAPSPPKYPFTTSAPDKSPFFQSYPSPPPPPSAASFATFPANISSLTVPGPSKANSTSSKLIIAAVAAVVAAITVVSLAVFLHLRHRATTRPSSSFNQGKPPPSDTSSAVSLNRAFNSNHIPKLHRPSQSSSEFLYLGTLVNSHALGGAASATTTNYHATNSRKLDSPELRPLSPLNTQRQKFGNNAEVISSRDDESEEFYSPKGSINGRESLLGTGSASRRTFAAVEVENFNGSTSNSSTTHSSSVPGSGSPTHSASANNLIELISMPKSPDLIEIQTVAPLPPQISSPLQESASSSPPNSSSLDRYSRRSDENSPRNSSVLDQNFESPEIISSPVHHSTTADSASPETRGLELQAYASPSPLELSTSGSPPRNSNASDRIVEIPANSSSTIEHKPHSTNDIPPTPDTQGFQLPESAFPCLPNSDLCDRSFESPVRSNNTAEQNAFEILKAPGIQSEPASPERLMKSKESSPRNSDVSNHNAESPVIISSPECHFFTPEIESLVLPMSSQESSPRNSTVSDQNVVRTISSTERNSNEIPPSTEMEGLALPESPVRSALESSGTNEETSPRYSDVESPVNSPVQDVNPRAAEIEDLVLSSPRISNVSDQSLVRISSPKQHELPERYWMESEESLSNDFDQNVESPSNSRDGISLQHTTIAPPPLSIPPPPPPPLPPLSKAWLSPTTPTPPPTHPVEPPALINPSRPIGFESPTLISPMQLPCVDSTEEVSSSSPPKPKLKPLHWDKVRASSDREMVWDQLKCSSFKLNEEMIKTLFVVNTPKPNPNEASWQQVLPSPGLDNGDKLLDPKKAQNIAILLKALHVTVDEVCEGLLEGNADVLGTELLESLLRMAPTKEEERKLKEYKDDSPLKLGPAERFLKEVVDVPHAFKRVEALLYASNFESEVDDLKKSFATLEAACEELRTSRMFLKLLEAVLKTGNRMNVGTNRGDAHAFKLDTLLKLVDVKGADGKTTLLHFVVQEMIRSEGARLSSEDDCLTNNDAKCRRLGLQVVSSLSLELSNVKKAAVMDAEVLSTDVSKLARGITNVKEIVELNQSASKFADSMISFIKNAEEENFRIQAQERLGLSLVKEITEYFHGNSTMEEPHPFRIFMVVRDFLTVLDRVCKDVGMINERTIVSSAHKFPVPVNPMLQGALQRQQQQQTSSDDDESLPLNV